MAYGSQEYTRLRNAVLFMGLMAWLSIALVPLLWDEPYAGPVCSAARLAATSWETLEALIPTPFQAVGWVLMLVAMMSPVLVAPIRHVYASSFAHRRGRSIAFFVGGYAVVWMAVGCLILAVERVAAGLMPQSYGPAIGVALVALVWQMSPAKQRCINRCHNHGPLAAFGMAADGDAVCMGLKTGCWCVGSCWAVMLLPIVLPQGHIVAMLAVGALIFCERLDPPRAPLWRWRGFSTAADYAMLRLGWRNVPE